jgi:hypothetical protein
LPAPKLECRADYRPRGISFIWRLLGTGKAVPWRSAPLSDGGFKRGYTATGCFTGTGVNQPWRSVALPLTMS